MKILTNFLLILLLFSCSTLNQKDIPTDDSLITLEDIQPTLTYDAFGLKVVLDRGTEIIEAAGDAIKAEKDFTDIGLYYGNGLFLDTNFNFYIDLVKLFSLDSNKNFTIKEIVKRGKASIWEKEDNEFSRLEYGLFITGKTFIQKDGYVDIEYRKNLSPQQMKVEEDEIRFQPAGLLNTFKHIVAEIDDEYLYINDKEKPLYVGYDEDLLNIKENKMIYMEGDKIIYSNHSKSKIFLTMFRSENRVAILSNDKSGIVIEYQDDIISVNTNGDIKKYKVKIED